MITIGITGINGLIGTHLRLHFNTKENVAVIGADRDTFKSIEELMNFVSDADVIIHLAGMNRGDDNEIIQTNISLTNDMVMALEKSGHTPHVLFSSSTQISRDNAYSRSKRECTNILEEWAGKTGAKFTNLIMPHIFGEWGKPFYNSVVSTFCYQLANNDEPEIQNDGELELLYTQSLASDIYSVIRNKKCGNIRLKGKPLTVSELLDKLSLICRNHKNYSYLSTLEDLDLHLLGTFCSYLFPENYPITMESESTKIKKSMTIKKNDVKCNYYNNEYMERVAILQGLAKIKIRKIMTDNIKEFLIEQNAAVFIDVPIYHTYNITNSGNTDLSVSITRFGSPESQSLNYIYEEPV